MSPAEARRAAALRFGGTLQTAEAYRDRQGFPLLESLWQDTRYAVRTLRRTPLFAVTVAATMGLGLGLLGSAFTILNAYLLRPIDLPNPQALYALNWDTETGAASGSAWRTMRRCNRRHAASPDWRPPRTS